MKYTELTVDGLLARLQEIKSEHGGDLPLRVYAGGDTSEWAPVVGVATGLVDDRAVNCVICDPHTLEAFFA